MIAAYLASALLTLAVFGIIASLCWMAVAGYRTVMAARDEERRLMRERQAWRLRTARRRMAVIDSVIEKRKRGA